MNKKAIAILGAIFILIVGTLGYLIFSRNTGNDNPDDLLTTQPTPTPTPEDVVPTEVPEDATTTPETSAVVKLTSDQVLGPALFFDGTGITYFDNSGNLYQVNLQDNTGQLSLSTKRQITIPAKSGITKILWPPKGNDFIAEGAGSGGKRYYYFNSALQTYTDLPPQVWSLDWMPNGTQIMLVWLEDGKATLNISNPDATNWIFLGDMWETDDAISVSPDGSQLVYYETGATGATNPLNSVTVDGKVWKTLVKSGFNFGVKWSPDGQKFLFSKKDLATQNYQLWVYNLTSGEVKNLGLFTNVDKTVWDKDSGIVYASVPKTQSSSLASLTEDDFFRVDTNTLEKKQYPMGETAIDGKDLFLNGTSDKLFFKNAQDGGLYYLDLTQ